ERRVVFPERQMACRLLVSGATLSIITDLNVNSGETAYRSERFTVAPGDDGEFVVGTASTSESAALPSHLRPCRLNDDGQTDYAGTRWTLSQSAPLPMPLYEI